jgi:hypothetical protein
MCVSISSLLMLNFFFRPMDTCFDVPVPSAVFSPRILAVKLARSKASLSNQPLKRVEIV